MCCWFALGNIYASPGSKVQGQHGVNLGPTGPRWAPCWPHELCYLGHIHSIGNNLGGVLVCCNLVACDFRGLSLQVLSWCSFLLCGCRYLGPVFSGMASIIKKNKIKNKTVSQVRTSSLYWNGPLLRGRVDHLLFIGVAGCLLEGEVGCLLITGVDSFLGSRLRLLFGRIGGLSFCKADWLSCGRMVGCILAVIVSRVGRLLFFRKWLTFSARGVAESYVTQGPTIIAPSKQIHTLYHHRCFLNGLHYSDDR